MVIQEAFHYQQYGESAGFDEADALAIKPSRSDGLVRSRVAYFETPKEPLKAPSVRPPRPPLPPRPYGNATYSNRRNHEQEAVYASRPRYTDSFSNLTMIDERRQEDYPTSSRSSTARPKSPLMEMGIQHYNHGEYGLAEKAFHAALKSAQAINSASDDISTALLMGNLGAVYLKQGKVQEALETLDSALKLKLKLGSKALLSDTYNNLGNCANLLGEYEDSLEYYRLALQELRQTRGRKADVADALFNIGRLEIQRENFKTAHGVLAEALRMAKQVYGATHVYIAEASDLLGFVQVSLAEHDLALTSFTKGLEIYRTIYGPLHPDVANAIFNIGMVREASGEFSDAREAYNTAQDLYRRLGTDPADAGFQTVRRSLSHMEKRIAQQNQDKLVKNLSLMEKQLAQHTQAKLIQKHQEALLKKKQPRASRSGRNGSAD
jgi:tetratricopeptide (TPR) repeat protein